MLDHLPQPEYSKAVDDLREVCLRVRDTLRTMVAYEPGMRPADVCRKFGVNKDVGSRIVVCCQLEDPLELAYRCPSPAALRRVVQAARDRASPAAGPAGIAVDDFERMVRSEFGDQSSMNVLIGSIHPDLREKSEAAQKQSAFRGMSQLHGLHADVSIQTAILARTPTHGVVHYLVADGCLGLRRMRPGPPIVLGSWAVDPQTGARIAVDGGKVLADDWGDLVDPAEAPAGTTWVRPRLVTAGRSVQRWIDADVLGTRASVSFGSIEILHNLEMRNANPDASPWCGVGQFVSVPSKVLIYDLLVEEGLFDDVPPRLVIYDTAMRGASPLFDPAREFDRLLLTERVDPLPPPPPAIALPTFHSSPHSSPAWSAPSKGRRADSGATASARPTPSTAPRSPSPSDARSAPPVSVPTADRSVFSSVRIQINVAMNVAAPRLRDY